MNVETTCVSIFADHHRDPQSTRLSPLHDRAGHDRPAGYAGCDRRGRAAGSVGEARFLRAPHFVDQRELGEGVPGRADVAPTMEWLAEDLSCAGSQPQLDAEKVHGEPIVYTLDEGMLSRYERRVVIR